MTEKPKYKLSPPHGERIYWQGPRVDSRVEIVHCDREWFWRNQPKTEGETA